MENSKKAVECFNSGFNCSQAVFYAFAEELGIENEKALKIASSFGGGMAKMGDTCGAVTGAFMALGMKYGRVIADDLEARDKNYCKVLEFVDEFKSRNKSIVCRELLGFDLNKTAEKAAFIEKHPGYVSPCPKLVEDAAEILERILL
jgi:C_GCAxxG_C_C family probable redox protein